MPERVYNIDGYKKHKRPGGGVRCVRTTSPSPLRCCLTRPSQMAMPFTTSVETMRFERSCTSKGAGTGTRFLGRGYRHRRNER